MQVIDFYTKKYEITQAELTGLICAAAYFASDGFHDIKFSAEIAERINSHLSGRNPFPDDLMKVIEVKTQELFESDMDESKKSAGLAPKRTNKNNIQVYYEQK